MPRDVVRELVDARLREANAALQGAQARVSTIAFVQEGEPRMVRVSIALEPAQASDGGVVPTELAGFHGLDFVVDRRTLRIIQGPTNDELTTRLAALTTQREAALAAVRRSKPGSGRLLAVIFIAPSGRNDFFRFSLEGAATVEVELPSLKVSWR